VSEPTDMTHPVTRAELKEVITDLRIELRSDITDLRTELRSDITELRTDFRSDISQLRSEMSVFASRDELAALRSDMNNSFASVAQQFVGVNQQITALATDVREIREGIRNLPEEIARFNRGDKEQTIREIRLLDDKYADLPARVKKLEEQSAPRAKARRRT
jgi:uncharacterized coiled-coil DUF342 family protein